MVGIATDGHSWQVPLGLNWELGFWAARAYQEMSSLVIDTTVGGPDYPGSAAS